MNLIVWDATLPRHRNPPRSSDGGGRSKRSPRRYYEPLEAQWEAERSGEAGRSVVRLERPPVPNKRRRAARRQTGRDKRPLRGEYTRSPQVGGTPEAGLIAKWAGRIFTVDVCARVFIRIYVVCDGGGEEGGGKKFLSVGSNGRWRINSLFATHADFIYVEISFFFVAWKKLRSWNNACESLCVPFVPAYRLICYPLCKCNW